MKKDKYLKNLFDIIYSHIGDTLENKTCNCGITTDQIIESGPNCEECYKVFSDELEELHIEASIVKLKLKMKEAISSEDYELAAKIRDEIASLTK